MRRSRKETLLLAGIAAALLALCSVIGAFMSQSGNGQEQEQRQPGDPADATGMVSKNALIGTDRPQRGARRPARFTLVEFADFQCASCAGAQPILRDLLARRADVRLIFRHCPLLVEHPNAMIAARAAEAARRQNRFWEMHDALYRRQTNWMYARDATAALTGLARSIGLDAARFARDLPARGENDEITLRIRRDLKAADQASVNGTPAFFLITPTRVWVAVGPSGLKRLRDGARYWH